MAVPLRAMRATVAIAVVTLLAYFLSAFAGPHILLQAGFIPARLTETYPFTAVPFWLTPLSATLLHGGLVHLGFNILMFVYCARLVENALGGRRLVVLYVLGAYGAAVAQYLVEPNSFAPMIGASGAISAVVGTYALLFGRDKVRRFGPIPGTAVRALWLAAAWVVLQWGIGLASGTGEYSIATAAHIGGFFTGLALAYPLVEWHYRYG